MIKSFELSNFKSVANDTEVSFAPLTIFAGANSSGKSTLLQALLLISQTFSSKVSSRSVVLNGNTLRLGAFDDLKSFGSTRPDISIACELEPREATSPYGPDRIRRQIVLRGRRPLRRVKFGMSFTAERGSDISQLQPILLSSFVTSAFKAVEGEPDSSRVQVTRSAKAPTERANDLLLIGGSRDLPPETFEYEIELDQAARETIREDSATAIPVGCSLRHFLPVRLWTRINVTEENARVLAAAITEYPSRYRFTSWGRREIPKEVMTLLRERLSVGFPFLFEKQTHLLHVTPPAERAITVQDWVSSLEPLRWQPNSANALRQQLSTLTEEIHQLLSREGPRYEVVPSRLPAQSLDAVDYIQEFFISSVRYLGPLREEPLPLYPFVGSADPSDVGMRGEYTAAVLELHKNVFVEYVPPRNLDQHGLAAVTELRPLHVAVLDWLHYMGIVQGLTTHDRGKLGHEMKVKTSEVDVPHDITHVGVGVSQVLPIVVMCLLADRDTTLILEQPELHLHPRVQTRLGDFFMSVALAGRQCLVETHSEYLINRLRLRIASSPDNSLSHLVRMYFVERRDGVSSYSDVAINRYGAVVDWPSGFFDESQRESEEIIKAAMLKKKVEREAGPNA
jgi:predicted ATPase